MQMNSPWSGRLCTLKETSRIAVVARGVPSLKTFVTLLNSTMTSSSAMAWGPAPDGILWGWSAISLGIRSIGKEAALYEQQKLVDAVSEGADDEQDQNNVFGQTAALAGGEQIAESVLGIDQLGEHDVAERHAEQRTQALIDIRNGESDEHFPHDLEGGSTERLRGFDIARRHGRNGSHCVGEDKRRAGDKDEHHLLRLFNAEP